MVGAQLAQRDGVILDELEAKQWTKAVDDEPPEKGD